MKNITILVLAIVLSSCAVPAATSHKLVPVSPPANKTGAASIKSKDFIILADAYLWKGSTSLLEVNIVVLPTKKVVVNSINAFEEGKEASEYSAISIADAANIIYPATGRYRSPAPVPQPELVGYTSTTRTNGRFNADVYNYSLMNSSDITGRYNQTTSTFIAPVYDNSAQNYAIGNNIGVATNNAMVQQQDMARSAFVVNKSRNMFIGSSFKESAGNSFFFIIPATYGGNAVVEIRINGNPYTLTFKS